MMETCQHLYRDQYLSGDQGRSVAEAQGRTIAFIYKFRASFRTVDNFIAYYFPDAFQRGFDYQLLADLYFIAEPEAYHLPDTLYHTTTDWIFHNPSSSRRNILNPAGDLDCSHLNMRALFHQHLLSGRTAHLDQAVWGASQIDEELLAEVTSLLYTPERAKAYLDSIGKIHEIHRTAQMNINPAATLEGSNEEIAVLIERLGIRSYSQLGQILTKLGLEHFLPLDFKLLFEKMEKTYNSLNGEKKQRIDQARPIVIGYRRPQPAYFFWTRNLNRIYESFLGETLKKPGKILPTTTGVHPDDITSIMCHQEDIARITALARARGIGAPVTDIQTFQQRRPDRIIENCHVRYNVTPEDPAFTVSDIKQGIMRGSIIPLIGDNYFYNIPGTGIYSELSVASHFVLHCVPRLTIGSSVYTS